MAKNKITKTIEIDYIATGAKEIVKTIEQFTPAIEKADKRTKKMSQGLLNSASKLGNSLEAMKKKGALDEDTKKVFLKEYEDIMDGMEKLWKNSLKNSGNELTDSIEQNLESIRKREQNLTEKRKEHRSIRVEKDDSGGFSPTTDKYKTEVENELLQVIKEQEGIKESLYSISNKEIVNARHLHTLRKGIVEASEELSQKDQIVLDSFLRNGEVTEELRETMDRIVESAGLQIDSQKAINGLIVERQIKERAQAQYQSDYLRKQELSKEIEKEQKEISVDTLEIQQALKEQKEETSKISSTNKKEARETQAYNDLLEKTVDLKSQHSKEKEKAADESDRLAKSQEQVNKGLKRQETTLGRATKQVFSYGLAFSALRRIYRETIRTIQDLDQALTEMAIVTTMTRKDTWALADTFQELARETGFTTTEIAQMSTVYFRQGRALKDVIELTRVAAQAARVAGISATESADYLTSAVNGFGLAAEEALAVSDRFAALAASSASSYEELAVGLSKFAAQANVAGLNIDYAMGMLAKGVETTREAPETIGTALKTVLARMRELTDYGRTLEDGMDVNRVETALGQVGIALRDEMGTFRDMQDVLVDIGQSWETMNTNQRASVAVALAGTRQQSRLIAIMNDFDRTMQLIETSQASAGATTAQHSEFMKGMEAAMVGLQDAWQEFIRTISESEFIIDIVNLIGKGLGFVVTTLEALNLTGEAFMGIMLILIGAFKLYSPVVTLAAKATKQKGLATEKLTASMAKLHLALAGNTKQMIEKNKLMFQSITLSSFLGATTKFLTKTLWTQGFALVAGTVKWLAFWAAATMGISLLITGISTITTKLIGLIRNIGQGSEEFTELQKRIESVNYELGRTNRSIDDLIRKYDELNSKKIQTEEDVEALRELREQIRDLVGEEYLVDGALGFDWEATRTNMQRLQDANEAQIRQGIRNIAKAAVEESVNIVGVQNEAGIWTGEVRDSLDFSDDNLRDAVLNFSLQEYEQRFGELNEELRNNLGRSLNDIMLENEELFIADRGSGFDFIQGEFIDKYVNDLVEFAKATESTMEAQRELARQTEEFSMSKEFKVFTDQIQEATEDQIRILRKQYPQFAGIYDRYGETLDKNFFDSLERHGIVSNELIEEGIDIFGDGFDEVLDDIEKRSKDIAKNLGVSETQAAAIAWSDLSNETENAQRATFAYGRAVQQTSLEIAQGLDHVSSRIENINSNIESFASGDLSNVELYEFFENYGHLFETIEDVDNFINGKSRSTSKVFKELKEQEMNAVTALSNAQSNLLTIEKRLEAARKQEEPDEELIARLENLRQYNLTQYALNRAILSYKGALSELSVQQQQYNSLLDQYNKKQELGIDTEQDRLKLNRAALVASQTSINEISKNLSSIESISFASVYEDGQEIEMLFSDIVDTSSGVAVLNYELLEGLHESELILFEELLEEYQNGLEEQFDLFNSIREENLKQEKESLDKQKKIYEDYFKELDRMENKRNRARDRQDLVAQLERLESATDEVSRRRALELRKELQTLDEDAREDEIQASREALLNSFDDRYKELEQKWALAGEQFIEDISNGGEEAGKSMIKALKEAGLSEMIGMNEETINAMKEVSKFIESRTDYKSDLDSNETLSLDRETRSLGGKTYNLTNEQGQALLSDGSVWAERDSSGTMRDTLGTGEAVSGNFITESEFEKKQWEHENKDNFIYHKKMKELNEYIQDSKRRGIEDGKGLSDVMASMLKIPNINSFSAEELFDYLEEEGVLKTSWFGSGLLGSGESKRWESAISDNLEKSVYGNNFKDYISPKDLDKNGVPKFQKGGMVDFTGIAELHGTRSQPEAVLSAKQTEMFVNLRNTLEGISFDGGSGAALNIEKIEIKTDKLNSNQDFKKAGETLGKAFESAIQKRGINLNVKR